MASKATFRALTGVLAVVAVAGSACGGGSDHDARDRVGSVSDSPPAATPTTTPTTTPPATRSSQTTTPPRAVLTHEGLGRIRLGMSLAALRATGLARIQTGSDPSNPCRAHFVLRADKQVSGYVSRGHGVVAIFVGRAARTSEGLYEGMPKAQARRVYPHIDERGPNGLGIVLSRPGVQPIVRYRFVFDRGNGPVTDLFLERSDQECYE